MRRVQESELGDPLEGFCLAGFDAPCGWGDWILPGDVVRYTGAGEWEHRECSEAERAMFVRPDR